jgi:hypothetical protein
MDQTVHVRLSAQTAKLVEARRDELQKKTGIEISTSAVVRSLVETALGVTRTAKTREERSAVAKRAVATRRRNKAAKPGDDA